MRTEGSKEQSWRTAGGRAALGPGSQRGKDPPAGLGLCPSWFGAVTGTDGKVRSSLGECGQKFQTCDPDFVYMFSARTMNYFPKEKKRKAVLENGVEKKLV